MGFEEEAIEEEIWQAIMNIAAGEEHLLETVLREIGSENPDMNQIMKHLIEVDEMRQTRKRLLSQILELRGVKRNDKESVMRSGTGELWCFSKHCLLIKMHLFETAQKYMNMAREDAENRKKWIEKAAECLDCAKTIHLMFMDTIDTIFPRAN